MNTVIDTPEGIAFYQLCARKHALRLEILGLKRHGRSVYLICKEAYGLTGSRQSVLDQLQAMTDKVLNPHVCDDDCTGCGDDAGPMPSDA